jgi:hypothetical protein
MKNYKDEYSKKLLSLPIVKNLSVIKTYLEIEDAIYSLVDECDSRVSNLSDDKIDILITRMTDRVEDITGIGKKVENMINIEVDGADNFSYSLNYQIFNSILKEEIPNLGKKNQILKKFKNI